MIIRIGSVDYNKCKCGRRKRDVSKSCNRCRMIKWGKSKKGIPLSKRHIENIKKAIKGCQHKHHIDLNDRNNNEVNLLKLTNSRHQKLHWYAYHYLVKVLGIKEVKKYIKWFNNKVK